MRLSKEKYRKILGKNLNHINIGSGDDISIKELSKIIKRVTSSESKIIFDRTKPDEVKRKLLDVSKMKKIDGNQIILLKKESKSFIRGILKKLSMIVIATNVLNLLLGELKTREFQIMRKNILKVFMEK